MAEDLLSRLHPGVGCLFTFQASALDRVLEVGNAAEHTTANCHHGHPPIGAPCTVGVTGCVDLAANVAATAPFVISATAVPLFGAAINTGELQHHAVVPISVAIPANVSSGAFTITWTISVATGP